MSVAVSNPIVLVVDDELEIRDFMQNVLQDEGLHVLAARNGQTATELATKSAVSLVVLDWGLPDTQGDALAGLLRQARGEGLPILLVTADGRAAAKANSISAYGYLSKPFNLDQFLTLVEHGLQAA